MVIVTMREREVMVWAVEKLNVNSIKRLLLAFFTFLGVNIKMLTNFHFRDGFEGPMTFTYSPGCHITTKNLRLWL